MKNILKRYFTHLEVVFNIIERDRKMLVFYMEDVKVNEITAINL